MTFNSIYTVDIWESESESLRILSMHLNCWRRFVRFVCDCIDFPCCLCTLSIYIACIYTPRQIVYIVAELIQNTQSKLKQVKQTNEWTSEIRLEKDLACLEACECTKERLIIMVRITTANRAFRRVIFHRPSPTRLLLGNFPSAKRKYVRSAEFRV